MHVQAVGATTLYSRQPVEPVPIVRQEVNLLSVVRLDHDGAGRVAGAQIVCSVPAYALLLERDEEAEGGAVGCSVQVGRTSCKGQSRYCTQLIQNNW